jgi:hypothetical protein
MEVDLTSDLRFRLWKFPKLKKLRLLVGDQADDYCKQH